jgi:hypothetical protein
VHKHREHLTFILHSNLVAAISSLPDQGYTQDVAWDPLSGQIHRLPFGYARISLRSAPNILLHGIRVETNLVLLHEK